MQVLDTLSAWVDQIPPVTQSLRYGNPAFRTWHARVAAQAQQLIATVLPDDLQGAATELGLYLSDSLGEQRCRHVVFVSGQPRLQLQLDGPCWALALCGMVTSQLPMIDMQLTCSRH